MTFQPPEAVADAACRAFTVKRPRHHYPVGGDARFLIFLEHMPDRLRDSFYRWMFYR